MKWVLENKMIVNPNKLQTIQCVKSARIRSFSGPYFPAFRLDTERYIVSFRNRFEGGKMRTRKIPSTGTFQAVVALDRHKSIDIDIKYVIGSKEI